MDSLHQELEDARAEKTKYEDLLNQSLDRERMLTLALEKCQDLHHQNGHAVERDALRPPPDKLFVDKLSFLRQNIREFTYQYFNSWLPSAKISSNSVQEIAGILNVEPFALFRTSNPSLVTRAYIWAFLARKVFGRFIWAGPSESMYELSEYLKPPKSPISTEDQERQRQFQLWQAKTSSLLQTARRTRGDKSSDAAQSNEINRLINTLVGVTATVRRIELLRAVNTIWAHAVEFDIVMHTQAPGLELYYGSDLPTPMRIDSTMMEVPGEIQMPGRSTASLIMEPALRRMGHPSGSYLASEIYLLKMTVTCDDDDLDTQVKAPETEKKILRRSKTIGRRWGFMKRGSH